MTASQRVAVAVRRLVLGGALASTWCVPAEAQQGGRAQHIGYLYPAGGRQGTVFRVVAGGQNLRSLRAVHITGAGVTGKVLAVYPPLRKVTPEERAALNRKMRELVAERWTERFDGRAPPWRELRLPGRAGRERGGGAASQPSALPQHPLLYALEEKDLPELLHVRHVFLAARERRQQSAQLAESVLLEVQISDDAEPGDRELRLTGRQGLTNPLRFVVGCLPEACELEPNDPQAQETRGLQLPESEPLQLPVVLNGQILAGDVDRFRFEARRGQKIVVEAHARRLIPYLADAVPGWFQATVVLYDADGNELAYADDYRFDADPVLCHDIPADGTYVLEVRDALYRGREDFVYRIRVGALPFVTAVFPLGTAAGHRRYVHIEGWNLTTDRLLIDPGEDCEGVRPGRLGRGERHSNEVSFAVDPRRAGLEAERNDTPSESQRVALACLVDGRIGEAGDVDVFRFKGKAGTEVVAEVIARRVNSPLDALLRLTDEAGHVLAWNDDFEHKDGYVHLEMGAQTHAADPRLTVRLPTDGVYFWQVSDAQGRGGPSFAYRLRAGPPEPGFSLRSSPSSLSVHAGGAVPLNVYALRRDGFTGAIDIALKDAPPGFLLAGARIPAGRDRVRLTLLAPKQRPDQPVALQLEGRARIDGQTFSRPVEPAEDMMQAFLYRHLVPSQVLLVDVLGSRMPVFGLVIEPAPVRIPVGGTAEVRINLPGAAADRARLTFELSEPPAGITLEQVIRTAGAWVVTLAADAQAEPGLADNLIVEAFVPAPPRQRGSAAGGGPARISAGFLPAIPFTIEAP